MNTAVVVGCRPQRCRQLAQAGQVSGARSQALPLQAQAGDPVTPGLTSDRRHGDLRRQQTADTGIEGPGDGTQDADEVDPVTNSKSGFLGALLGP